MKQDLLASHIEGTKWAVLWQPPLPFKWELSDKNKTKTKANTKTKDKDKDQIDIFRSVAKYILNKLLFDNPPPFQLRTFRQIHNKDKDNDKDKDQIDIFRPAA